MKKIFLKKLCLVITIITTFNATLSFDTVYGQTNKVVEGVKVELGLDDLIGDMNEYLEDSDMEDTINMSKLVTSVISGEKLEKEGLIQKIIDVLSKEIIMSVKSGIAILIVIICMGVFNSLDIDKEGDISKIVYLVSFLIIVSMLANIYLEVISNYAKIVNTLCSIIQTVTPFMMIVLVASGGAITSSLIQPLILFIASLVGFLVSYICIPFITISIVMKIVSALGDNIKLGRLGNLFSKSSVWICTVVFALFLTYVTIKGTVSTSVDAVAIKTTQTAISNFVPVVGKFVSDSLESIMGATEVIGKTAGVIGIVVMLLVTLIPVIKLVLVMVCHKILAALSETITDNKKMIDIIDVFGDTYKTMLGILIGIVSLFILSTGVVIKLMGQIG